MIDCLSDLATLNSQFFKLVPVHKLDLPSLKFRPPPGFCVHVEILEMSDLPAADFNLIGRVILRRYWFFVYMLKFWK